MKRLSFNTTPNTLHHMLEQHFQY